MSLRERKKERRERRILDSGLQIMQEKGFSKTSMEEIAELAEVGVGTVYNYFSGKDDLLIGIVTRSTTDMLEQGRLILDHPPGDPLDGIAKLLVLYARGFHKFEKELMLEVMGISFSRMTSIGSKLMEQDYKLLAILEELIGKYRSTGDFRPDLNAEDAAFVLYGNFFLHFTLYLAMQDMTMIELEQLLKKRLDICLNGMKAGGAA